jgi:hypothetical protein
LSNCYGHETLPSLATNFETLANLVLFRKCMQTHSGALPHVAYGSSPCENSNACRARRNILEKLRIMRTDAAADIRLDAVLENCVFYISPMYEFSHSLGHLLRMRLVPASHDVRNGLKAGALLCY